jgi:hypothetical protein
MSEPRIIIPKGIEDALVRIDVTEHLERIFPAGYWTRWSVTLVFAENAQEVEETTNFFYGDDAEYEARAAAQELLSVAPFWRKEDERA